MIPQNASHIVSALVGCLTAASTVNVFAKIFKKKPSYSRYSESNFLINENLSICILSFYSFDEFNC